MMETKTNKENELEQQPLDENELDEVAGGVRSRGGSTPPTPPPIL